MTDIVPRLRNALNLPHEEKSLFTLGLLMKEASDTIEQLRLEKDRAIEGKALANDLVRLLQNEVRW
jgi:hypothetical protein